MSNSLPASGLWDPVLGRYVQTWAVPWRLIVNIDHGKTQEPPALAE